MRLDRRKILLEEAWVGDAVLALYARGRILREDGRVNAERFIQMTSNQFLNAIGEPSGVEADIGRVYAVQGLAAAFQWIELNVMPMYLKQQANRLKGK